MCASCADSTFLQVQHRLADSRELVVLCHARPDGDALGSLAALARSAAGAGKTVHSLVPDAVPERYEFLFPDGLPLGPDAFAALARRAEAVVVLDTSALAQLDGLGDVLREVREKVIVIDHHATADDVGGVYWQDTSAAAAGVMVGELIEALGWPLDDRTAESLVTALVTDTGWLRFANTDARCLRAVARWGDGRVRMDKLYQRLYQCDRLERLRLLTRVLEGLELHSDGRLAVMAVRADDFVRTGARPDETENLVNEALRMGSVETALLLVEQPGVVRVSLRSRDAVDVAAVAGQFGGGGHPRAAGLRAEMDLDELKAELITACTAALAAACE